MMTDQEYQDYQRGYDVMLQNSALYHRDAALRARLEAGDTPAAVAAFRMRDVPPGMEVRVVAQTPQVYYLQLPPDPNETMSDALLGAVVGGDGATTASCAGTIPSTVSTIGCLSCEAPSI